jgi:prepilin-type N-terminal cleavage/methylation domain-containing protein
MTLVEVMVALTIAGIALAAGASVLGFLTDQQSRSATSQIAKDAAVRDALRDWLASAQLGTAGDLRFIGERSEQPGQRGVSVVDFVTSAPTPVARGGDARTHVRLGVVRNADGVSQVVAAINAWPAGDVITLPIADSVTGFDVRYLASVFGLPRWTASWQSASVLPAAIDLRVISRETSLLSLPVTIVIGERR